MNLHFKRYLKAQLIKDPIFTLRTMACDLS